MQSVCKAWRTIIDQENETNYSSLLQYCNSNKYSEASVAANKITNRKIRQLAFQHLLSKTPASVTRQIIKRTDDLLSIYIPINIRESLNEQQKKEITEFLRRIDKAELNQFLGDDISFQLSETEIDALKNAKWDHEVYKKPNIHFVALKAFVFGWIDRHQVSAILVFLACRSRKECQFLQLLSKDGTPNQKAVDTLKASLNGYYTDDQLKEFLLNISSLNPQNTQFYSVPIMTYAQLNTGSEKIYKFRSVVDVILDINHTFLVQIPKDQETRRQIVLPPHLMIPLLQAKFGTQTMMPNPVLGSSVAADNFKRKNERDVLIPCPLFPKSTPTKADEFHAPDLKFYHHDMAYHVVLECANPHRSEWIELAKLCDPSNQQSPIKSKDLYQRLLDREFRPYLRNFGTNRENTSLKEMLSVFESFLLNSAFLAKEKLPRNAVSYFRLVASSIFQKHLA